MSKATRSQNLRVGIFLVIGIVLTGGAIFAIGEKSGLFSRKTTLYVYFDDISGLVAGAPVRLAGLDVGTVEHIEFPEALGRREARVTLSVKSEYMTRVRGDSVAIIDSKGLLGDKIINLSLGSESAPELTDGAVLKTRTSPSMEALATQIGEAISGVTQVTETANTVLNDLVTDQVQADIGRIIGSTANLLEQVENGDGIAHRLLYDRVYAEQLEGILVETRSAIIRLRGATERIDRTVAAIEQGDGMLHELVYGETGKQVIADLQSAAAQIAEVVREVREGKGLLHGLIYEEEDARMLTELNEAAGRVNRIVSEIERGRGTLGGLIVDPSVYEDLKTILGNVERNVLLKALIRFTIKEGDIERPSDFPVKPIER